MSDNDQDGDFLPIIEWHKDLLENKGARARLARCASLNDICFEPEFVYLCQKLDTLKFREPIALVAGVLSGIKNHTHESGVKLAARLGEYKDKSDRKMISEKRFCQILRASNLDDLFVKLKRMIKQIENKTFDYERFLKDIYWWTAETNYSQKDWAFAYYSQNRKSSKTGDKS